MSAIEAAGLKRRFGSVTALDDVSLSIERGEFFSLLGPSGCGKTTLLRLIAGLDIPDSGTLRIGGLDMSGVPAHLRPVNTVFQSYALFPHLTVFENVSFGLRMKGLPNKEIRDRVARVMDLAQIEDLGSRRPNQLSGGQKQRVALARAVVNEPQVLLLDEPLGALDLKLRKQLQVELHQLQRRLGITFIHVTHDQDEALVMSDRIAVMNEGRIEQVDSAEAIYEQPRTRFVAQFLGSCNLTSATITAHDSQQIELASDWGTLSASSFTAGLELETGRKLTVGIRPEKIRLHAVRPTGADNVITATVYDLVYSGAETRYELRAGAAGFSVGVMNTAGGQSFTIGSRVECEFPTAALLLLDD